MDGLDILEHNGTEYRRLVNNAKWTLASLNWAPRFDENNLCELERHNLTEETFVLLQGKATLVVGEMAERIEMQPLKYYNVRAGIWHHILVSEDARVLVAENADTSKDNTEYLSLATGEVYRKYPEFEEILPDTFLLKVPFGPVWTGIILIKGEKNILIDSSHLEPEKYLIPALGKMGMKVGDIDWLLNTHVHGDHIGGHHQLATKYGLKTTTLNTSADALRDPVKVAIRVRTKFPKNSPAPQSYLKGVEPDKVLCEGELLEGRFYAFATPGHDDDCLTWVDTKTGTAFTGDSIQGNGTPTQGVAFYRDRNAYLKSLKKLSAAKLENIVCGHDYDGIGIVIKGADEVAAALQYCSGRVELYDSKIKEYAASGMPVMDEPVAMALKLIGEVGCGMPDQLFLALHTVSEHLK